MREWWGVTGGGVHHHQWEQRGALVPPKKIEYFGFCRCAGRGILRYEHEYVRAPDQRSALVHAAM